MKKLPQNFDCKEGILIMLIVIIHSRGMAIPYHVISDLSGIKEPAGTHIPLPAKSKREVVEGVQEFIEKAHQETSMISLLVVSEDLYASLTLEQHEEIDCMLFQYADNSGAPAESVWK